MKHLQYNLTELRPFTIDGVTLGTLERVDHYDRINGLRIVTKDGHQVDLPGAVDISEELDEPRVFVIEGADPDRFFVFGGEIAFWVSVDLTQIERLKLFRDAGTEEYWATTILEQPQALIIIYEAGVLVIDERLQVLMHQKKFFNDSFITIEENALKFVRDHDEKWLMPLDYLLGE